MDASSPVTGSSSRQRQDNHTLVVLYRQGEYQTLNNSNFIFTHTNNFLLTDIIPDLLIPNFLNRETISHKNAVQDYATRVPYVGSPRRNGSYPDTRFFDRQE
jgi:hypothetical protein